MKILPTLFGILFLSGCATRPVSYVAAVPVAQSNLLDGYKRYSQPNEGWIRVIVVRDSGMLGAAVPAKLSIDGIDVAKLWSGKRLDLYMPPSTYIFGVEPSPRMGGALVETTFEIKPGKTYAFRISLTTGGAFSFQQSTQLQ